VRFVVNEESESIKKRRQLIKVICYIMLLKCIRTAEQKATEFMKEFTLKKQIKTGDFL
jgi:hypothetical protein